MEDLDNILLAAVSMARLAGAVHLRHFRKRIGLAIHAKLNESDIVTIADKESEQVIINEIHRQFPSHSILSEESGSESRAGDYCWVIDPLDGTTNYTAGLPVFSVSIAVRHAGQTVVGVVYAPYLDELFTAVRGRGAFLNGNPIAPKENPLLERAVVSTGFPVDKNVNPDNNLDNVARVLPRVRGLRRLGSAAVDICYVAAGFLDAYWECNLHEWDVDAALLILHEAGGRSANYRSDRNISVLTSSEPLFPALLPLIH